MKVNAVSNLLLSVMDIPPVVLFPEGSVDSVPQRKSMPAVQSSIECGQITIRADRVEAHGSLCQASRRPAGGVISCPANIALEY
jgi:hypothetical protein